MNQKICKACGNGVICSTCGGCQACGECGCHQSGIEKESAAFKADAVRYFELLELLEWIKVDFGRYEIELCPYCKADKRQGHRDNCMLDETLVGQEKTYTMNELKEKFFPNIDASTERAFEELKEDAKKPKWDQLHPRE